MKIVQHGNKLEGRSCCKGWGNAIWSAKIMRMSGRRRTLTLFFLGSILVTDGWTSYRRNDKRRQ